MKTRVISAIVLIAVVFGCFLASEITRALFILVATVMAIWEMCHAIAKLEVKCATWVLYAVAVIEAVLLYFGVGFIYVGIVFFLGIFACLIAGVVSKDIRGKGALFSLTVLVYPIAPLLLIFRLALFENWVPLFAVGCICSWACDAFALFGGMLFGKNKVAPEVSPNKTIEGCISGAVFSVAAAVIIWFCIRSGFDISLFCCMLTGLVCSTLGQFGDLSASLIKRTTGIKDYSKLIPGHGGVMDRLDALLFSVPSAAICFMLFGVLV